MSKWMKVVLVGVVLLMLGTLGWRRYCRHRDLAEIGRIFRGLRAHVQAGDFDAARLLCSADFDAEGPISGFDEHGNEIAPDSLETIAVYFADPIPSDASPSMCGSENGALYFPDCVWSDGITVFGVDFLKVRSGVYFEFTREKGQWKFTGSVGRFVD